jgi:acyl carrier protein
MNYFDEIKNKLEGKLNGKELTPDTVFKDLNMDSLDLVDLVFELEEALEVQFEDDELFTIKTVQDLLDLIAKKGK